VAEPVGDDERFSEHVARARAALGRPRPRPVPVPDPVADDPPEHLDERDARIAELEAENRRLRRALDRIRAALDS
jgi:hypothetical protein